MCTRAGSLASIHSEQENWFIWERLTALAAEPAEQMYWLGMRKPAEIVPDEDGEMQKKSSCKLQLYVHITLAF